MTNAEGTHSGPRVFAVDSSVRRVAPTVVVGGSPLRAIRFRRGSGEPHVLATSQWVRSGELSPATERRLSAAGLLHPDPQGLPPVAARDVSVVIPVRDRADYLDRILRDLASTFRCIVVDDASHAPDGVRAVARRHGASYLYLNENVGPAGARNAGLDLVGTPLVLFIDSDMRMDPQDALLLMRHFADERVGAVAPRVVTELTGHENAGLVEEMERVEPAHDMGSEPSLVSPRSRVPYVPTACLACRVEAIETGFDVELRTGEDVDFVWRMVDEGWIVRYEPAAEATHASRPTVGAWLKQHYGYGLSAADLAGRHGADIAPARLPYWAAVFDLAILAGLLAGVRPAPRSRVWRWTLVATAGLAAGTFLVGGVQTRTAMRRIAPGLGGFADSLTVRTLGSALQQGLHLWLRHWSPAVMVGLIRSVRIRRVTFALAVADAIARPSAPGSLRDAPVRLISRAITRTAYGVGVWRGALRRRTLLPIVPIVGDRAKDH